MLPSEFAEVADYPGLRRLLRNQVDMQVQDLRTMLELPQREGQGGCNFAATSTLLNLVSGASVYFLARKHHH